MKKKKHKQKIKKFQVFRCYVKIYDILEIIVITDSILLRPQFIIVVLKLKT